MHDPFQILEPTCISFSGGRTSAYMLWRVLQSNGGKLPEDAIVCFANTGKEDEATLKFVRDCEVNWNVKIHWLEYCYHETPAQRFKVVDYETASRDGQPFFELIDQNGSPYLPNPVARICTAKLKIRVIHHYLKSIGWEHDESSDWVGIRADEQRRASKIDRSRTPLVVAGITKEDVGAFWRSQPFDLGFAKHERGDHARELRLVFSEACSSGFEPYSRKTRKSLVVDENGSPCQLIKQDVWRRSKVPQRPSQLQRNVQVCSKSN
jgi:hypothetical protein